jgi:hypothetical protein
MLCQTKGMEGHEGLRFHQGMGKEAASSLRIGPSFRRLRIRSRVRKLQLKFMLSLFFNIVISLNFTI